MATKRYFSPEARDRIRIAQKRRWRAFHKATRVKAERIKAATAKRLKTLAKAKRGR